MIKLIAADINHLPQSIFFEYIGNKGVLCRAKDIFFPDNKSLGHSKKYSHFKPDFQAY
jgi:hypothetical protein